MKVEFIIGGTHLTASFGGAVMVGKLFTPRIGENGNWFVGDTDTGVSATKLPNALTFTGAASGVYDGSEPVEVEIPKGDFGYVEEEGGGLLVVTVDANNKASHTAADIYAFVDNGGNAVVKYTTAIYNLVTVTESAAKFTNDISTGTVFYQKMITIDGGGTATIRTNTMNALKNPNAITFTGAVEATYDGSKPVEVEIPTPQSVDIPETLPNPNAITFTGAVEATYDGSQPVEVEIPEGGSNSVYFGEEEPADAQTGDFWYDESEGETVPVPRIEMASTDTAATIEPNRLYVFPEMASLDITLGGDVDISVVQEYRFRFTSGATATTLTLPANVIGDLSVEANKVYEVSILDGYLVSQSWEVS